MPLVPRRGLDIKEGAAWQAYPSRAPHTADDLSLVLADPAALLLWIARLDECSGDLRNQRLESHVPTVLPRIENTLPMDDPADVAGMKTTQRIGSLR